jgi:hypothetical protein
MSKRDGRKPKPALMLNGQCIGDDCASWRKRYDGTDYCAAASRDIKRLDACPLKTKWREMKDTEKVKTLDKFEEGKNDE